MFNPLFQLALRSTGLRSGILLGFVCDSLELGCDMGHGHQLEACFT